VKDRSDSAELVATNRFSEESIKYPLLNDLRRTN
jgi:hypothetical protein